MERKPVYGDRWAESELDHARRIGLDVLRRAATRRVVWPPNRSFCPSQDVPPITLDEAFETMMDSLCMGSCQCKRYFKSTQPKWTQQDFMHCSKYHSSASAPRSFPRNPIQRDETVHLQVQPGRYAVTAGKQTRIIQVHTGGAVNLDFVI